jgi:hypothetical protein
MTDSAGTACPIQASGLLQNLGLSAVLQQQAIGLQASFQVWLLT